MEILIATACIIGSLLMLYATFIFFVIQDSEGKARYFMNIPQERGMALEQGGRHYKFLYRSKNKHVNADGKLQDGISLGTWISKYILWGRVYKGLGKVVKVKEYRMRWQEWQLNGQTNEQKIVVRDESTKFVFTLPFAYAFVLKDAEDSNNLKLDIKFTVYMKPTGLYTAFYTNDWFTQMTQKILAGGRNIVGGSTFENLRSETDILSGSIATKEEFKQGILSLSSVINASLEHELLDVVLNEVDPAGSHADEVAEALSLGKLNQLKADAAVIEAEGKRLVKNKETEAEAYSIKKKREAEAEGIELVYKAQNSVQNGGVFAMADAIKNHNGTLVIGKEVIPTIQT